MLYKPTKRHLIPKGLFRGQSIPFYTQSISCEPDLESKLIVVFVVSRYGCPKCVENASRASDGSPAHTAIVDAVRANGFVCCGVLAGNRNFEGEKIKLPPFHKSRNALPKYAVTARLHSSENATWRLLLYKTTVMLLVTLLKGPFLRGPFDPKVCFLLIGFCLVSSFVQNIHFQRGGFVTFFHSEN